VIPLFFAVSGIIVGRSWGISPVGPAVLFVAAVVFLVLALYRLPHKYFIWALALAALSGAGLNANLKYQSRPQDDISNYLDLNEPLRFFGKVDSWPVVKRHKTLITVSLDSMVLRDSLRTVSGTILLHVRRETTHFAYGDGISFTGTLQQPREASYPGQFDYQRYLAHKGIRGIVYVYNPAHILVDQRGYNWFGSLVNNARQWILDCFNQNLRPLPAALASGFLIGETRDIPAEIYLAFRDTGTLHLLAVSGSNVILVLLVFSFLLNLVQIKKTARLILLLAAIVFFCHLSYNQPSVIRASVMAVLVLLGRYFYRRVDLNNVIAVAALVLILYDPGQLFDIGFQLSFAVAWSLIMFLPQLNRLLENRRTGQITRYITLLVFSSVIASLVAAPITAHYFGRLSLITVFSNLAIVPLVSLAVIGIVVLILSGAVWPAIAIGPGMVLDRLLSLIDYLVNWFAGWDLAAAQVPMVSGFQTIAWLAGVFLILTAVNSRPVRRMAVLYFLLVFILITTGSVLNRSRSFDLEIITNRNIQAIIYRPAGVVIYRNNSGGDFDDFANNFLPYLKTRDYFSELSQFIIFEPEYKRPERIEQFAAEEVSCADDIKKNYSDVLPLNIPQVYRVENKEGERTCSAVGHIVLFPGTVTIYMPDSTGLVISNDPGNMILPIESDRAQKLFVILIAGNDAQLAAGLEKVSEGSGRIILEHPPGKYNLLFNNQLDDDKRDLILTCKDHRQITISPVKAKSQAVRN